ncbi:hypothetical protein LTS12_028529, partial [Elasticomyces elasticus]
SDVVRLVHYTVQQYFEHTWSKWFGDESIALADTCITYLSFDILATGPCDNEEKMTERFENYALLKYTAQYWGDHARDVQEVLGADDTSEVNAALSFVRNKDLVLSAVQAMWTAPSRWSTKWASSYPRKRLGIHLVAKFGLVPLVNLLLETLEDVDAEDDYGWTPDSERADRERVGWTGGLDL